MKKKIFTLLTLLSFGLGVNAATSVPTKDTQIACKTFVETTLLWTSSTNFATWYAEGWATSGKSSDRSSVEGASKYYTLEPTTGESCSATSADVLIVKQDGDKKQIFMYVTNITKVEAYFINTKAGTETRTAKIIIDGAEVASEDLASNANGTASCKLTKDGLTASNKYLVQFNASADMGLYAVRFTAASASANVSLTIPASGYATFSSASALDLSSVDAYVVSALSSSSATLNKVTEAPANTGLVIIGAAGPCDIPVKASASAIGTNYLKASVKPKTAVASEAYIMSGGKFHPANAGTIPAGKAYLLTSDIPGSAHELSLDFGGATGITSVSKEQTTNNGEYHDLQGRRIAQPTKGLYIVNGKKVIVK